MKPEICNAHRSDAQVDAFTAEVIRSTVVAITDEMKTNLMRTAYNMIIYEAEDFTVGLFDLDGNTISIGLGLPMFIRGFSPCRSSMTVS
jgi:N-methylhydantoinase B